MKLKIETLSVLFGAVLLAGGVPVSRAAGDTNEVVARIGDSEVKVDDLRAALQSLSPAEQSALQRDPSLINQVVRTLLVRRLVLKEAEGKQWDKRPDVVAQIERAKDATVTESYLQSVSQPPASYPSTAELQAAYDANKAALLVPQQFRIAQIYIAAPKDADKASLDKAQEKLDAVKKALAKKGADFAAIAKEQSDEKESASRGGEIGWLADSRLQPEIRKAIASLSKDTASEPIRLDDGWHIVKVLEIKDSYTPTLEEVKAPLAQQMRVEKARANSQAYLASLLQQNPVAINELALMNLLNGKESK